MAAILCELNHSFYEIRAPWRHEQSSVTFELFRERKGHDMTVAALTR